MAGMPSDSELEIALREVLRAVNVEEASLKMIRQKLEARFQVDLSEKKAFLKGKVTAIMLEGEEDGEEEGEEEEEEEEEEEVEPVAKKTKARSKRTDFQLSPALFEFMGSKETMMARGDVTKAVWEYIREAELQDPKDRRKIRNDDKMFRVFKCKTMNMMHIAKKLSPHLKKYSELVVGDDDEEAAAGSSSSGGAAGKGGKKRSAAGSKATTKAKKAKAGGAQKGRPKAGSGGGGAAKKGTKGKNGVAGGKGDGEGAVKKTRKPSSVMWRVTDELAAVVGSNEATVDTIRSGVYGYIKEHNLQDPQQRTTVICDPTLERVMGQKVVKMFGMQSLISPHRLHKL
eukprot:g10831.t2